MIALLLPHLLSIVVFLFTLLFVSSIIRTKRAAGSTIAWLLLICVFPYIGIPFYLFLSKRKLSLVKKEKLYLPAKEDKIKNLSSVQKILSTSGTPKARLNQSIQLLSTGVEAYDDLIALIKNARRSIYITTFVFGNDGVGKKIVRALAERAKTGIDVRVIVDSFGATIIRHPSFAEFKRLGGKVAYFMPIFHLPFKGRSNLRNHRKMIVVDKKVAILGGMNLAEEYLGPVQQPQQWVDLSIKIEGTCVHDIEDVFLQDWDYAIHRKTILPESSSILGEQGNLIAQIVASGPDVCGDPLYDVLLIAIYEAQNNISIVTPYFIPDESLTKALELAARRGVSVQIVIPKHSNHPLADIARGSFIRQLEASGAAIEFYPTMIHSKVVMIDQSLAILGSANFDMRSLLLIYELGLMIYSEETLKAVENWLQAIKLKTVRGIPKSNFFRDLAEGIGRVIGPVL